MSFKLLDFFLAVQILAVSKTGPLSDTRRGHLAVPEWLLHCWDHSGSQKTDPYCALLNANCSSAPEVDHGSHVVSYSTSVGSSVVYSCNDNYALIGPQVVTCGITDLVPQWSTVPVCKKGLIIRIVDSSEVFKKARTLHIMPYVVVHMCEW